MEVVATEVVGGASGESIGLLRTSEVLDGSSDSTSSSPSSSSSPSQSSQSPPSSQSQSSVESVGSAPTVKTPKKRSLALGPSDKNSKKVGKRQKRKKEINGSSTSNQTFSFRLDSLYNDLKSPTQMAKESVPSPIALREGVQLYDYQLTSVARMLELEENLLGKKDDDDFVNHLKNLFPANSNNFDNPNELHRARGGILCEEMGTGKTAICIALICLTRRAPNLADISPRFATVGKQEDGTEMKLRVDDGTIPQEYRESLAKTLLWKFKYTPSMFKNKFLSQCGEILPSNLMEDLDGLPLAWYEDQMRIYFGYYTFRIYLSNATLIVVPMNLIDQWHQEFMKYVVDQYLKILVIRNKKELPRSPEELARYDVVITTHSILSTEGSLTKITKAFENGDPEAQSMAKISPLMQVHWQRIIVDEGHVMGNASTNRSVFAEKLYANKLWVCSGTPTPSGGAELDNLFGLFKYLRIKPLDDNKVWRKYVRNPIKKERLECIPSLKAILQHIMVKHSAEEVRQEIELPPLKIKETRLQFNEHEKSKYNKVVAMIHTNLLTSLEEGPDSLFAKQNRKHAIEALHNLQIACLYRQTSLTPEEIDVCLTAIDNAMKSLNYTQEQKDKLYNLICEIKAPILPSEDPPADLLKLYSEHADPKGELPLPAFSTKLNYLITKLMELTPHTKCIIFSSFSNDLRCICDALDHTGIPFVEFHEKTPTQERSSNLTTFNTSDSIRIIVMQTNLAAYGINCTAANYIFLMDPIWESGKERQAIKRAHRIGQKGEVIVEKLIIRDTIEDKIMSFKEERTQSQTSTLNLEALQENRIKFLLKSLDLLPYKKEEATSGSAGEASNNCRTPMVRFSA